MISQENRLFCHLDGLTASAREQQRLTTIQELGLLQAESIPIFDEATQTVAQTLDIPVCILGVMELEQQHFKAAVGLSRLGLMNKLAASRQIHRLETFCTYVVDSHQPLTIDDTLTHPVFSNSLLVYEYGIRSYLGVPLLTSSGCCVGTLAVLDIQPRQFSPRDIDFLQLMARWSMSEFERTQLSSAKPPIPPSVNPDQPVTETVGSHAIRLQVELLGHLSQELRTPLTSMVGMANILTREIYGPLTSKQKEYLNIIHGSGQYLLSLMNEIVGLAEIRESHQSLNLSSVDVEFLSQQVITSLEHAAQRREQQLRLTVEPGHRIWLVDKEKIRQVLYHLIFSLIQSSVAGSIVRLHVSRREANLQLSLWVSHPWLGEGLPHGEGFSQPSFATTNSSRLAPTVHGASLDTPVQMIGIRESLPAGMGLREDDPDFFKKPETPPGEASQKNLGLMLSQHLIELHGGQITLQGEGESGYRYVINLPRLSQIGKTS